IHAVEGLKRHIDFIPLAQGISLRERRRHAVIPSLLFYYRLHSCIHAAESSRLHKRSPFGTYEANKEEDARRKDIPAFMCKLRHRTPAV
ncbi:MAG: hypothetical protein CL600_09605, partial [Alteromonas sp.]|nr:hypothetical protein [Alteromonas sp.]